MIARAPREGLAALVLTIATVAIVALATEKASAGTVQVYPDVTANNTQSNNGYPGTPVAYPNRGVYFNLMNRTTGAWVWMKSQRLPAGVNLEGISFQATWMTAGESDVFRLNPCIDQFFSAGPQGGDCSSSGPALVFSAQSTPHTGPAGVTCLARYPNYDASNRCSAVQFGVFSPHSKSAWAALEHTSATIADNVNPVVNSLTAPGANLSASGWHRGSRVAGAGAGDAGTGVSSLGFAVDGTPLGGTAASCSVYQWIPCPGSHSATRTVDTTNLTDGPHTLTASASDPTGNGASGNFTFRVDNTAPDTPSDIAPAVDGDQGWSATNDFGASWTNGSETDETTTQSGVESVVVDVNPTDPDTQSNPAPVTVPVGGSSGGISATIDSVSGVTVPSEGEWKLQLRLIDRAGNTSPAGDGSSETSIGLDTTPAARATGRANGWVNRTELENSLQKQTWDFPQAEAGKSPVCGWGLSVNQTQMTDGRTSIDVASPTVEWTIPNAPGAVVEGENWVHIRAIGCNGVPAAETEHMRLMADFTDPDASYSGVEEGKWYRAGQVVTMRGSDNESGMAPAPAEFPKSTSGAFISYLVNGEGPLDDDAPRGGEATVAMSGEGPRTVKFSPVDVAGNRARETKVSFGVDATSPIGYLDTQDPARPTLISAPLTDGLSGVASALISVRNTAGGNWQQLPTALADPTAGAVAIGGASNNGVATARFPDTKLPKGTYEVRVAAFDQAGNELVTAKNKNGQTHTVSNPMRSGAGLSSAIYQGLHKCKRKRKSKCIKKKKGRVVLVGGKSKVEVGFRRAGVVQGYLTRSNYSPLARQPLEIYTKAAGEGEVLAETVSTKSDGSFYYRLRPGVSRDVRVHYPGTELIEESDARVKFDTRGKVKLKVNRKKVKSGQTLRFSGRVYSYNKKLPAQGKLIVLQFYSKNKWRPAVTIARTDSKGKFRVSYKFDRATRSTRARIKFRVFAPAELDWPHASTASRRQVVKLNWR